jgi:hypothetical protein
MIGYLSKCPRLVEPFAVGNSLSLFFTELSQAFLYYKHGSTLESCASGASAARAQRVLVKLLGQVWGPAGAGVSGGGQSKLCSYV